MCGVLFVVVCLLCVVCWSLRVVGCVPFVVSCLWCDGAWNCLLLAVCNM